MKIKCETCEGGQLDSSVWKCAECDGVGYTNPPQQILDDLECAEIEREIISKGYHITTSQFEYENILYPAIVLSKGDKIVFYYHSKDGNTKLEALRKAKEWIEGRG